MIWITVVLIGIGLYLLTKNEEEDGLEKENGQGSSPSTVIRVLSTENPSTFINWAENTPEKTADWGGRGDYYLEKDGVILCQISRLSKEHAYKWSFLRTKSKATFRANHFWDGRVVHVENLPANVHLPDGSIR